MKIHIKLIFLSFVLLSQQLQAQLPNCSEEAGFKSNQDLTAFTENLKIADSAEALSPLISYPLRINTGSKKHFVIKNENEFKSRFKEIFPKKILNTIHAQDPKITFCNYQGLTIGGVVWIAKKNGKSGIYVQFISIQT